METVIIVSSVVMMIFTCFNSLLSLLTYIKKQ